jgi:hypothetical protein
MPLISARREGGCSLGFGSAGWGVGGAAAGVLYFSLSLPLSGSLLPQGHDRTGARVL